MRGPVAQRQQLKFDISVTTDDSEPVKKFNPNLKPDTVPRWTPDHVQSMFALEPPTLTKKELIEEMQSLAKPQWSKEHGVSLTSRNALKRCSVAALIDK
jgi:hypothetical protein